MRINNNNFQRNSNISRVIEAIWRQPEISRIDIARQLELYRSTVSNIIGSLIENGAVIETEQGESLPQGGRKPIFLTLNTEFGCIIGLEIQPLQYWAVAVNMYGDILYRKKFSSPVAKPEDFVNYFDAIIDSVLTDIWQLGLPVLGICVGLPGIINADAGMIIRSDPLELTNFNFTEAFDLRYGIPVIVENDANCCAWLQLTTHRRENIRDFISVMTEFQDAQETNNKRTGIAVGVALSIDGRVRYGKNYGAGEFISLSWRPGMPGQTGLPESVIANIANDTTAFKHWAADLVSTLAPILSVLAPDFLYLHGFAAHNRQLVLQALDEMVPQFKVILEKTHCTLEFADPDEFSIARGAASMLLQRLFSVPDISEVGSQSRITWDYLFELSRRQHFHTAPKILPGSLS
jgi:predicted NBD/HSP70 family sugar kinase